MAFERAQRFQGGLAFGEAASVVGAAGGVVADLGDGHDVQDPVDSPVPGAGEPVAFLVAGGGFDRGGAVPRGEMRGGAEPGDVTDVADQPGGSGRTR
jgi:hypothetical protein